MCVLLCVHLECTKAMHASTGWPMLVQHLLLLCPLSSSGSWRDAPHLELGQQSESDIVLGNTTRAASRRSLLHNRCPGSFCVGDNVLRQDNFYNGPVQGPFVSTNHTDQYYFPAGIFLAFTIRFDLEIVNQANYICCFTPACQCGTITPITYGEMLFSFRLNFSVGRLCDDLNNLQSCTRESQEAGDEITLGDASQKAEPAPCESLCRA